jgi:NAD(P)-dependent dehydrogenase (short-subunit alcohol dehydrogenase family)/acyl carrier protein
MDMYKSTQWPNGGAYASVPMPRSRIDAARWVRDHEPLAVPPASGDALDALLPAGATVLITGGLGDVGLVLAGHLARTRSARLVLTAGSPLPAREDWPGHLRRGDLPERSQRHIRNVLALEAASAQVLALSADVADAARMAEVVRAAERRFGGIDLVVHGSGVSDPAYFGLAADLTRAQADAHFRAKVHGFLVLREVLADRPGLPGITLSSLAAVLGGLAFAGYAGSNAALDAYVAQARAAGGCWLTVDWEGWRVRTERHLAPGTTITDYPMREDEALDVFDRSLALIGRVPHLVTSSGSLAARTADWVAAPGSRPEPGNESTVDDPVTRHPRPSLSTGYEPPAVGEEDDVAQVWSEVLGVDRVGAHDNFFELGGHSLLATQLVSRLQSRLAVAVPVLTVLQHPTVRSLTRELVAGGTS